MKIFRSIKLAIALIVYLIFFFILSTFIPQNMEQSFYLNTYPVFLGRVILFLKLDAFSGSIFFLIPCAIFFINLLSCSIHRFFSRVINKLPFQPGPDILHIGILILLTGAFISFTGRKEAVFYLSPGNRVNILKGYELLLNDFSYETYPGGRPKRWSSSVVLKKDGTRIAAYDIEVNKPLRVEGYKIFQESYSVMETVSLTNGLKREILLKRNESFRISGANVVFTGTLGGRALFTVKKGGAISSRSLANVKDRIEGFSVKNISYINVSGLKIVYDPGIFLVLISFLAVAAGFGVTLFQKRGDFNI